MSQEEKQKAYQKILSTVSSTGASAAVVFSAVILGGAALVSGVAPGIGAIVASGLSINLLSNLIDRIARGEDISNEQVVNEVQNAISQSGLAAKLVNQENQRMLARVFREQKILRGILEGQLLQVLERILELSNTYDAFFEELKKEFEDIHYSLQEIRDNQQHQATKEQIDHVIALLTAVADRQSQAFPTRNRPSMEVPSSYISQELLLERLRYASASLRDVNDSIAGAYSIERKEVDQIADWLLSADEPGKRFAVLVDLPGMGKTVVMSKLQTKLEAQHIPVLALKADRLSEIRSLDELSNRLNLPTGIEYIPDHFESELPFILLIDQLDALSQTLSRDQATLDVMLDLIATLRSKSNVKIIASCRTFDLEHDPRLSDIKVDQNFRLSRLDDNSINLALQAVGVQRPEGLPGNLKQLLSVPLHLDLYGRIIKNDALQYLPEQIYSLQHMFRALWKKQIEVELSTPDRAVESSAVTNAIKCLVEQMINRRNLIAPVSVLDGMSEAANYLQEINFIQEREGKYQFFHQTFFDYCYARQFVESGRSISEAILNSPQGLFERTQMIQVIAHLRDLDEELYQSEVRNLLLADSIREHLRFLLIDWLASLPNGNASERAIIKRLFTKQEMYQRRFMLSAQNNKFWFDLLDDGFIGTLVNDVLRNNQLHRYLELYFQSLINLRTERLLELLEPLLDRNEAGNYLIKRTLAHLVDWNNQRAVDLLLHLLHHSEYQSDEWDLLRCLGYLASSNPAVGCRAFHVYLDKRVEKLEATEPSLADIKDENGNPLPSEFILSMKLDHHYEKVLDDYHVIELAKNLSTALPLEFLNEVLVWLTQIAIRLQRYGGDDHYPSVHMLSLYHISMRPNQPSFVEVVLESLRKIAVNDPNGFRDIANDLKQVDVREIQELIASAYLVAPENYATDIFDYLIEDIRRLDLGDPRHISGLLLGAAFRILREEHHIRLEQLILDMYPEKTRDAFDRRSFLRLRLFQYVSPEFLSDSVRRELQELQRKYPEMKPEPRLIGNFEAVQSPIPQDSIEKMSNAQLIDAMRKYDDSTGWGMPREHFLKGGIVEFSRAYAEIVKKYPERFYDFGKQFDENIAHTYIQVTISSLAHSEAPAGWVYELARQYAPIFTGENRMGFCRALEARAKEDVPDDLIDLMMDWAYSDPNPGDINGERNQLNYWINKGINSVRGVAVQSVWRCSLQKSTPQYDRIFDFFEKLLADPSPAVGACMLEGLQYLFAPDKERAITLSDNLLETHPELLDEEYIDFILGWATFHHYAIFAKFLTQMLASENDRTRSEGARLLAQAAFNNAEATALVEEITQGDSWMRRGLARNYTDYLKSPEWNSICQEKLRILMHDDDKEVLEQITLGLHNIRLEHIGIYRDLLLEYIQSPALNFGAFYFFPFLKRLAVDEPEFVLRLLKIMLEAIENGSIQVSRERGLVSIPLVIYQHALGEDAKSEAMDIFDQFLVLGVDGADKALKDWDEYRTKRWLLDD